MKVETTVVKQVEVVVNSYTLCDKCNNVIESENPYDQFESTFIYKTGEVYPEGGSVEEIKIDLCKSCAVNLLAQLQQQGYRVNNKEYDV